MTPGFADPAATRCWNDYFDEVGRLLAGAGADAAGIREDLELHVAESMSTSGSRSGELHELKGALQRLGTPMDYLRPLIADDLLERGARTYRPTLIARGLLHSMLAGSKRAAIAVSFGLGYLFLAAFAVLALLKPVWGDHVGLFRWSDGRVSAGIVSDTAGARELLGLWSIPIALAIAAFLYVALTAALRAVRSRR